MRVLLWCGKKVSRWKFSYFSWLARKLPTCEEIAPLISRDLDTPLPVFEKIKMVLHKHICEWCRRYANQLLLIREAMRKEENAHAGNALSSTARERMKRALTDL